MVDQQVSTVLPYWQHQMVDSYLQDIQIPLERVDSTSTW